ncbi:glycosyltransferase family 4 protein [Sphingobacterium chungjuense]|uniref:glycosyltransferase family 4 protein n=1 Tax=Sphingobacterium chungjuense TaxID=2675553 RepID=UPI00140C94B6|nr:glycosyltransferase family 4 protein [Sphingobacterium chungjuense]
MNKIAIIVHRYGPEINGGAEEHARQLAGHLKINYKVDVLTSCSLAYPEWDNYYPAGKQDIDGIDVLRFHHESSNLKLSRQSGRYLQGNLKYYHRKFNLSNFFYLLLKRIWYKRRKDHDQQFEKWIDNDGPICTEMLSYLRKEKDSYRAFIFFTYMFYPTFRGLPQVAQKSILIPTAHDEPFFYLDGFRALFASPRFIMYNSIVEKELTESVYPTTKNIRSDIAGVGFDDISSNLARKRPMTARYVVYLGRIDEKKGFKELFSYFVNFRKTSGEDIQLVVIGKNYMKSKPQAQGILYTGFISDEKKIEYLQHSEVLIIPSRLESLSIVTLEALSLGRPVLANGYSPVLAMHVARSNAGFIYYNQRDFNDGLIYLLNLREEQKNQISKNGITYVRDNYNWDSIVHKFNDAINYVGRQ